MSGLYIEFVMWVITTWAFGWAGYTAHAAMRVDCPFDPPWRICLVAIVLAEVAFGLLCGSLALDVHFTRLVLQ